MVTISASTTPSEVTYGRYRACRPLGTAYGLATWSLPPSSAISMWGAMRLQSTACPQQPRKTRGSICKDEATSSVSRSPLDNRAPVRQRDESPSSGNPHRPQARLLLSGFILRFPASRRFDTERRATHAPSLFGFIARSPRSTLTPAPTGKNSCRRIGKNNCRCTTGASAPATEAVLASEPVT